MPDPLRAYWDACVFLSYLEDDPDRAPDIEAFLEKAEGGEIQILTSVLSIAEVAFTKVERDGRALNAEEELRIDQLWDHGSPVELVELHPQIARSARTLVRAVSEKKLRLSPRDAIHLATAERMEADKIHTYDTKWSGDLASFIRCPVEAPLATQLPLLLPTTEEGSEE